MKKPFFKYALAALLVASLASCDDDDSPEAINEEELITTVTYTLVNDLDDSNIVVFRSFDADGDGPTAPQQSVTGELRANAAYTGAIAFLNESDPQDVENITEEVLEEADEHEVFYATPVDGVEIIKIDEDSNGNPLGLRTSLTTEDEADGNLVITLLHEPTKPNNGTVSNAGGEPDAEVTFELEVEEQD